MNFSVNFINSLKNYEKSRNNISFKKDFMVTQLTNNSQLTLDFVISLSLFFTLLGNFQFFHKAQIWYYDDGPYRRCHPHLNGHRRFAFQTQDTLDGAYVGTHYPIFSFPSFSRQT